MISPKDKRKLRRAVKKKEVKEIASKTTSKIPEVETIEVLKKEENVLKNASIEDNKSSENAIKKETLVNDDSSLDKQLEGEKTQEVEELDKDTSNELDNLFDVITKETLDEEDDEDDDEEDDEDENDNEDDDNEEDDEEDEDEDDNDDEDKDDNDDEDKDEDEKKDEEKDEEDDMKLDFDDEKQELINMKKNETEKQFIQEEKVQEINNKILNENETSSQGGQDIKENEESLVKQEDPITVEDLVEEKTESEESIKEDKEVQVIENEVKKESFVQKLLKDKKRLAIYGGGLVVVIGAVVASVLLGGKKDKPTNIDTSNTSNIEQTTTSTPTTSSNDENEVEMEEKFEAIAYNLIPTFKTSDTLLKDIKASKKATSTIVVNLKHNNLEDKTNYQGKLDVQVEQNTDNIEWVSEEEDDIAKGKVLSEEDEEKLSDEEKIKKMNNPTLSYKKYNGIKGDMKGTYKVQLKVKPKGEKKAHYDYKLNGDITANEERTSLTVKSFSVDTKSRELKDLTQQDKFILNMPKHNNIFFTSADGLSQVKEMFSAYNNQLFLKNLLATLSQDAEIEELDEEISFNNQANTKEVEEELETTEAALEENETIEEDQNTTEEETNNKEDIAEQNDNLEESSILTAKAYKITLKAEALKEGYKKLLNIYVPFASKINKNAFDVEGKIEKITDEDSVEIKYSVKDKKALVTGKVAGYTLNGVLGHNEILTLTNAENKIITISQTFEENKLNLIFDNQITNIKTNFVQELNVKKGGINNIDIKLIQNKVNKNGKENKVWEVDVKSLLSGIEASLPIWIKVQDEEFYAKEFEVKSVYVIESLKDLMKKEMNDFKENKKKEPTNNKEEETSEKDMKKNNKKVNLKKETNKDDKKDKKEELKKKEVVKESTEKSTKKDSKKTIKKENKESNEKKDNKETKENK